MLLSGDYFVTQEQFVQVHLPICGIELKVFAIEGRCFMLSAVPDLCDDLFKVYRFFQTLSIHGFQWLYVSLQPVETFAIYVYRPEFLT